MLANFVLPHAVVLVWVRFTVPLAQFAGVWVTTHWLYDVHLVPDALVHATPLTALGTAAHGAQVDVEP